MQVSRVVGQNVFFDAGDSLSLNQQAGGLDGTARDLRGTPDIAVGAAPVAAGVVIRPDAGQPRPDDLVLHRQRDGSAASATRPPDEQRASRRTSTTPSGRRLPSTSRTCRLPTTSPTA